MISRATAALSITNNDSVIVQHAVAAAPFIECKPREDAVKGRRGTGEERTESGDAGLVPGL